MPPTKFPVMQTITIIGNLAANATVTAVGERVVIEARVAVNSRTKKQDGTPVETTNWYKIKQWLNKDASTKVADFMTKGKQVAVTGTPSLNVYTSGSGEARGEIEITYGYNQLELLSGGKPAEGGATATEQVGVMPGDDDNDLPF